MTSVLLKNCNLPKGGFQGYRTHDDLEALFLVATVKVALERTRQLELEKRIGGSCGRAGRKPGIVEPAEE
jgi:hypothetical protein